MVHLLALNATPHEILFRRLFAPNTSGLTDDDTPDPISPANIDTHFIMADSLRSNTHLRTLTEAAQCKDTHTTPKLASLTSKSVTWSKCQMYDSKADFNYVTIYKMVPCWSQPRLIIGKFLNSFRLSSTQGAPLKGLFHTRRLRLFVPLRGSTLDLIAPRDTPPPTEEDLEIADAEEHMLEDLITTNLTTEPW